MQENRANKEYSVTNFVIFPKGWKYFDIENVAVKMILFKILDVESVGNTDRRKTPIKESIRLEKEIAL